MQKLLTHIGLILLIVSLGVTSVAAETFSKTYGTGYIVTVEEGPNGSIFGAGQINNYSTGVIKTDQSGTQEFQKHFPGTRLGVLGGGTNILTVDEKGGHTVIGGKQGIWPNWVNSLLISSDKKGKLKTATHWYYGGQNNTIRAISRRIDGDGHALIVELGDFYQRNSPALVLVDNNGKPEFETYFSIASSSYRYMNAILPLADDSGYIIGGTGRDYNSRDNRWIVKLAPTGEVLWSKTYGPGIVEALAEDNDGNIIVSCSRTPNAALTLQKIDSNGNSLWEKGFMTQYTYSLRAADDIYKTTSGDFLLAGRAQSAPWVAKINSDGELLWERKINVNGYAYSVREAADGDVVIGGQVNGQAWIAKMTDTGTIAQYSDDYITETTARVTTTTGAGIDRTAYFGANPKPTNYDSIKFEANAVNTKTECAGECSYESTIFIAVASHDARKNRLEIEALSNLGKESALEVQNYGPMQWSENKATWYLTVDAVDVNPGTITVSGLEGSTSTTVK